MRIGIDVRCLAEGKRTGVEEYVLNLLPNIFEIDKKNDFLLFFNSFKGSKVDFNFAEKYPNVEIKKFNFPNKILNFLLWYLGFPKIDRLLSGVDCFFMPNLGFGSVSKKCRLVLAVHDLSFERYPEKFSRKRRWWHIFINPKKLATKADKIIAVSNSTKNDLLSLYGLEEEKLTVVHSAISDKFNMIDRNELKLLAVKEKYALPYKFILYLGTIEPRKNIESIILAFEEFQKEAKEKKNEEFQRFKLVIAGGFGGKYEETLSRVKSSKYKERVILTGAIDEADKAYIYNLASVFIFPSYFEGFGFPPLEAMACGVPVVCSNNSSLPEVVGDAAILIDPGRPGEINDALQEIISNKIFREKMVQKGLLNAKRFNWQETARQSLAVIRNR